MLEFDVADQIEHDVVLLHSQLGKIGIQKLDRLTTSRALFGPPSRLSRVVRKEKDGNDYEKKKGSLIHFSKSHQKMVNQGRHSFYTKDDLFYTHFGLVLAIIYVILKIS